MRALITGQTGTKKTDAVKAAVQRQLRNDPNLPDNLDSPLLKQHLSFVELEQFLPDITGLLDCTYPKDQRYQWSEACKKAISALGDSDHQILLMHASYYRHGQFFNMAEWQLLREFRPDVIVSLYDDTQDIFERVASREAVRPTISYLTLQEIMLWRSNEQVTSELLGANLCEEPIPVFICAVKQPPVTLQRLLFERNNHLTVYASFPITKSREDEARRAEVDEFRHALHSDFITFDPLTIDERSLVQCYENGERRDGKIVYDRSNRWPMTPDACMVPPPEAEESLLAVAELEAVAKRPSKDRKNLIDCHIQTRDFRLVQQVRALAVLRPDYLEKLSTGVFAEIGAASAHMKAIQVLDLYGGAENGSPFDSLAAVKHSDLDSLISALKTIKTN